MKFLGKYWIALVAVILLAAAGYGFRNYQTEKEAYEAEVKRLNTYITSLENSIAENQRYADIQELLPPANEAVEASRLELYQHFPVEMKEEDQIMYMLYLETIFGTEISFGFSAAQPITALMDGSTLMGLSMTFNYETTYQGFQDMVNYLATDSRITSVQYATIQYDAANDVAAGYCTVLIYLIDSDLLEYVSPEVQIPETGKDVIFD